MNVNKVKKIILLGLLSIIPLIASVSAYAQKVYKNGDGTIDVVDNTNGFVVIDDSIYKLKLNTKIYNSKKKKLNRYALKEGQYVFFEVERENKIEYVNYIEIND